MRSYNIALFYFKNRNVLTLPLTWRGKIGMCQQCKWTCVPYCTMHTHATGTGHGLVAPLALCLRPARKKFSKNCATRDIWNPSYQKKFGKYFFGRGKMFAMPGVGPRPACHIPDPRDSWQQRTLWFSHVIVSQAVIPGLQGHLKIGIC